MGAAGWAKRLECPVDEDAGYVNDRWTNRDLIPIPPDRRTYKIWSFAVSNPPPTMMKMVLMRSCRSIGSSRVLVSVHTPLARLCLHMVCPRPARIESDTGPDAHQVSPPSRVWPAWSSALSSPVSSRSSLVSPAPAEMFGTGSDLCQVCLERSTMLDSPSSAV